MDLFVDLISFMILAVPISLIGLIVYLASKNKRELSRDSDSTSRGSDGDSDFGDINDSGGGDGGD